MHHDDFPAFDACFQTYEDPFSSTGGYHYDWHSDVPVDPWLESFDAGTTDVTAIGIRLAREAGEQMQAQAVVRGVEPACFASTQAGIEGPQRWKLATQLSTALSAELGYVLDDRDNDCWHHPCEREWRHMPTDRIYAYNAAYERFCRMVGKRLPAAAQLSEDELYEADVHAQMLAAERELEPSAMTRLLDWLRLKREQLLH